MVIELTEGQLRAAAALAGAVGGLLVFVLTRIVVRLERRRRTIAHWDALTAELEFCRSRAERFIVDGHKSPLYRMPTVVFDAVFSELLKDAALPGADAGDLLRLYGEVGDMNRGLDACAAALAANSGGLMQAEYDRLLMKAPRIAGRGDADVNLIEPALAVVRRNRP
jgi:hypothetical protein